MSSAPPQLNWNRLETLFHEALRLSDADRGAFLDRSCGEDRDLRKAVVALLQADAEAGGFDAPSKASVGDLLAPGPEDPVARAGARVGAFRLERCIGVGGMGTVWLATRADEQFEQRVAIKLIKRGMDTEEVLRRFRRERQVLAHLEHPNIARLLDGGATADGRPFLVMEHIDGKSITDYCAEQDLPVAARLRMFLDVCGAVQYAHQNLIIHRDLKPTNILVSSSGTPKLLDFGIAKILRAEDEPAVTTTMEHRLLTPRYASPEQVKNERVTTATDTYALGVVLYELLTGGEPYQLTTRSRAEYERAICEQEPLRPSLTRAMQSGRGDDLRRRRQLSGDLDTIVLKALRKDPAERYASVERLTDDLQRYLSGLPVRARAPTWAYRTRKFCVRNKVAVLAGLAVATALSAAAVVSTRFALREAQQRTLAEQRLQEARTQQAVAEAINRFLNQDLLAAVDPDRTPDPNVTMRAVLDAAAGRMGGRFPDQPIVEAEIRLTLGATYESLGELEAAESHFLRAREIGVQVGAENSDRAIYALASVGNIKRLRSRLDEAEPLIRKAHEMAQSNLEARSLTALYTRYILAELYINQARFAEAIDILRAVTAEYETAMGPDARRTLAAYDSLGVAYSESARYEEAEKLHMKMLERKTRILGPDSLAVISTLDNLGFVRMSLGRYDDAEPLFRDAVERGLRVLGDEHPNTLLAMDNLGLLCTHTGRYEEAERLHNQAYEGRTRTLGPDHGDTLVSLANVGFVLTNSGQWEKAERLYAELVPRVQRANGREHPFAITAQNNLAFSTWKVGRPGEAESMFHEVVQLRERVLGLNHPETLSATLNLAAVRIDLERFQAADELLAGVIARGASSLPAQHPILGATHYRKGLAEFGLGNLAAAAASFDRAKEILTISLGPEHPRVAAVVEAQNRLNEKVAGAPQPTAVP